MLFGSLLDNFTVVVLRWTSNNNFIKSGDDESFGFNEAGRTVYFNVVEQRITINFSLQQTHRRVLILISVSHSSATAGLQTSGSTCWSWASPTTSSASGSTASASAGWRPTRRPAALRSSATPAAPLRAFSPSQTRPSPGTASPSANRPPPAAPSLSVST